MEKIGLKTEHGSDSHTPLGAGQMAFGADRVFPSDEPIRRKTMSQAEILPSPNIIFYDEEEKKRIFDSVNTMLENDDDDGLLQMVEKYPMSAETLNMLKRYYGIEFLLEKKFNIACAIEKYGEEWLEK